MVSRNKLLVYFFTFAIKINQYEIVVDPSIKYINLTSHDATRHYVINAFNPVTFSASVNGYPTPTLTW